jgi:hypothetical protein
MLNDVRPVDQSLIGAIVERLPVILTEVERLLDSQHPEYAGFLAAEFDEVVSAARGFVVGLLEQAQLDPRDQSVAPRELGGPQQLLFEEIGRRHCQEGRDVTALLGLPVGRGGGVGPHRGAGGAGKRPGRVTGRHRDGPVRGGRLALHGVAARLPAPGG